MVNSCCQLKKGKSSLYRLLSISPKVTDFANLLLQKSAAAEEKTPGL